MKQSLTGKFLLLIVAGHLTTPAIAYADSILLIDGTKHDGVITAITDDRIILSKDHGQKTFLRLFVREILFEKSDLLVLATGDTLIGRILQQSEEQILVALWDGMRTVSLREVTRVLPLRGPSFKASEVIPTDGSFRYDNPNPSVVFSQPIRISISLGSQDIRYSFSGNSIVGPAPFEKALRGSLFRIEVGTSIYRSIDLMIGASWGRAQTPVGNISGPPQQEIINYTSLHAAGLFSVHAWENRLGFFARLQAGLLNGSTQYDEGEMTASFTPGVGMTLSPVPFAGLLLEADLFTASLLLDQFGHSIGRGTMLWAGVWIDFSMFSTSTVSTEH